MHAIGVRLGADGHNPLHDEARILPDRDVETLVEAIELEVIRADHHWVLEPRLVRFSRAVDDLEPNRLLCPAMHDACPVRNLAGCIDVGILEPDETATTQLAVRNEATIRAAGFSRAKRLRSRRK